MKGLQPTCQAALRSWNRTCLCANGPRRAFSRSWPRPRSALPVYLEPSSPELSSLLTVANAKLLLPYHLTKEQEKLIYRKANQSRLEADPIDITIGHVTLPLEHIDRNHLPNRRQTFKDIVLRSKSADDWANVIRLLEGFGDAGIRIDSAFRQRVVRHLTSSGNQHLILKAFQQPKTTEFRLSDYALLMQTIRCVHESAAQADWAKEETTKSLRFAMQIVELMDDEEHCGGHFKGKNTDSNLGDWRGSPIVIALPTAMAARLAEKHGGNKEEVTKLANRLVNALKQNENTQSLLDTMVQRSNKTEADFSNGSQQINLAIDQCNDVLRHIIVWNALKTSSKVLGTDMPLADKAQKFEQKLGHVLNKAVGSLDKSITRKGEKMVNGVVDHTKKIMEVVR